MKRFISDVIRAAACLLPLSAAAGCSAIPVAGITKETNIRYANMPVILESLLTADEEWINLSEKKKAGNVRIDQLKKERGDLPAGTEELVLSKDLAELQKLEDRIRKRIYPSIYAAVKNVARRSKYDFILNMDDTVLYAESGLDVTGEILQELKTIRARSDPLFR